MHVEIYKQSFSPAEVVPVMPCQQIAKVQISAAVLALALLFQSHPLADPSVGTAASRDQMTGYAVAYPSSISAGIFRILHQIFQHEPGGGGVKKVQRTFSQGTDVASAGGSYLKSSWILASQKWFAHL